MLGKHLTNDERTAMFEGLIDLAVKGTPPPTENGMAYPVVEALEAVAASRGRDVIDAVRSARSVFAATYG